MRRPTEAACPHYGLCFFSRQRYNPQWQSRQPPKLHRESQPPLCEPGLMGLTSRQARFVSGPVLMHRSERGEAAERLTARYTGYTCSITRIVAFFLREKSRSSYLYKL